MALTRAEAERRVAEGVDEKWPDDVFLSIVREHCDLLWRNVHHWRVKEDVARLSRNADVLDAGCSTGILSEHALHNGARSVVGLDIVGSCIHKARLRCPSARFEQVDLSEPWPVEPQSRDLVICVEVFEHIREQAAFLAEVVRVLRPGGHLVLTTPNGQRWFPQSGADTSPESVGYHWHEPTKAELSSMLEGAGLTGRVTYYRYPKVNRMFRLRGHGRLARLVERIPPRSRLAMGLFVVATRAGGNLARAPAAHHGP
jgi:2-polyprenyl-3-methyl-5-hydroxy-6-metoxy-1,4-benzoquinol methylase